MGSIFRLSNIGNQSSQSLNGAWSYRVISALPFLSLLTITLTHGRTFEILAVRALEHSSLCRGICSFVVKSITSDLLVAMRRLRISRIKLDVAWYHHESLKRMYPAFASAICPWPGRQSRDITRCCFATTSRTVPQQAEEPQRMLFSKALTITLLNAKQVDVDWSTLFEVMLLGEGSW